MSGMGLSNDSVPFDSMRTRGKDPNAKPWKISPMDLVPLAFA